MKDEGRRNVGSERVGGWGVERHQTQDTPSPLSPCHPVTLPTFFVQRPGVRRWLRHGPQGIQSPPTPNNSKLKTPYTRAPGHPRTLPPKNCRARRWLRHGHKAFNRHPRTGAAGCAPTTQNYLTELTSFPASSPALRLWPGFSWQHAPALTGTRRPPWRLCSPRLLP